LDQIRIDVGGLLYEGTGGFRSCLPTYGDEPAFDGRDAEIGQDRTAVASEQHVAGLHVTVQDADDMGRRRYSSSMK
jgi:hypothetical protein